MGMVSRGTGEAGLSLPAGAAGASRVDIVGRFDWIRADRRMDARVGRVRGVSRVEELLALTDHFA